MLASPTSRASAPASRAGSRASSAAALARAGHGRPRTGGAARRRPVAPAPRATAGGGDWFSTGKAKFFELLAGSYDAPAVNAYIDAQIKDNAVIVFSWSSCPFCVKAKRELQAAGARFAAVEIDGRPDGKAIKAELARRTGRTSVPQVWIKGEYVGGCNDGPRPGYGIVPLAASGQLAGMLKAAGAL
jgi:glutaredoxin 3